MGKVEIQTPYGSTDTAEGYRSDWLTKFGNRPNSIETMYGTASGRLAGVQLAREGQGESLPDFQGQLRAQNIEIEGQQFASGFVYGHACPIWRSDRVPQPLEKTRYPLPAR